MSTEPPPANADQDGPSPTRQCPLILLPGLGCDARMFSPQRAAFPELIVPQWIPPERKEPLAHYAARFAKVIDPGVPCFLGGVSFGGVVALEVATHLATRECYLFGSIRGNREIPIRLNIFRHISDMIMILKWSSPVALNYGGRWFSPAIRGVLHQLKDADPSFVRWAARAILHWKPSPEIARLHIVQIHGDRDWVFPIWRLTAEKTIKGAGHLMSMTHADEVNAYVRERMSKAMELPANPRE